MKLLTVRHASLIVVALLCSSCGRKEGPLGVHVGDTVSPAQTPGTLGAVMQAMPPRDEINLVDAIGDEWISIGGRRYTNSEFIDPRRHWYVSCPHGDE